MNGPAQVGQQLTIEVNYDVDLFVGLTVFNDSGDDPIQIGAKILMLNVISKLYRAKYTPLTQGSYLFRKAVYTTADMDVLDPLYAEASEAVQVLDLSGGSGGGSGGSDSGEIVGEVDLDSEVIALVEPEGEIV